MQRVEGGGTPRWPFAALAALAVACSGEGDDAPDFRVAFEPGRIDAYATAHVPKDVEVRATLTPRPTTSFVPVVTTTAGDFEADLWAFEDTPGSWTVRFTTKALPLGSHAGELTVHLCRDGACSSEFTTSGATIPYSITAVAPMTLGVSAGGVAIDPVSPFGSPSYPIVSGEEITITSNVPVARWELGSHTIGTVTLTDVATTETSWTLVPTFTSGFGIVVVAASGESAHLFFH